MHGDPRYEDLHKFLDRSVQRSLHPKIKGYAPHGNQRDERPVNGFGQKKASAPENRTMSSSRCSGTSTFSGNHNRLATHRLTNIAQRGLFRADVRRTEVEDAALTGGDSIPPADAAKEEVADGPAGQDEPTDRWDSNDTWEDNYSWDELSDYGGDAYDVCAAEVVCAKVDDTVDAPAATLPAADDRLVRPWSIPVTAETNGKSLAMWAELDTGASRTLVSAAVADELCAKTTRHLIKLRAEVLPGKCGSPILIGCDILSRYPISDLLSVLCDRGDEPLATTTEPDIADPDRATDSAHRAKMLVALASELDANAGLDPREPCPIPEALV
ncbi:hypothetical protein H4R20_002920 [Coemansia guatemalensis]|uniref:Uncharacterized protein n=1 Tax=Coemansia guatemalensis TaxID=2761395 RepID=A0A9W8LT49_9FUNG|nr:hypothetical protein H4R20_002920 [Coemansia guatemalensis]